MRNWELKKVISLKSFFFSKQSSVPEASSFDNRFKNYGWNTIFFWWKLEETFKKKFLSLNKDFFQNVPMYTLIVNRTPLLKSFCPQFRKSWKIKKNSTKRLTSFPLIFHLVHCTHAVECKRKEILLEHLRKCEKMHFKIINVDGIALKRLFKTFFLFHVVKVCEKEVFHFRKLKVSKNCLFAKKYTPVFLKKHLQESLTAQNNSGSWLFFCFCVHVWMRSKSHQHRSCIFCQKIGTWVYTSNRCWFTLREKIGKTRMLSVVCGTQLAVLLKFSAESQASFKSNSKNSLRKQQPSYRFQNVPH